MVEPSIQSELHPGEAVEFALGLTHPFATDAALVVDLLEGLRSLVAELVGPLGASCSRPGKSI